MKTLSQTRNRQVWPVLAALLLMTSLLMPSVASAEKAKKGVMSMPPTPEMLKSGAIDLFAHTPKSERNNKISLFYATLRLPAEAGTGLGYSKNSDDTLRFGVADMMIGPEGLSWDVLHAQTTTEERTDTFEVSLQGVKQLAELPEQDSLSKLTPDQEKFIAQVNSALEKSYYKDLTIFVHGAFNSFYYAAAEATQYKFFTGKQAVVLLYSWPAVENHIAYGRNVKHAVQSEPAFNRMIKMLGKYSKAEHINILAYSIGGRLVGGAMATMADNNKGAGLERLHKDLRLGHLYLTSSDEPIEEFYSHADAFTIMFDTVTVTADAKDPVLGFAEKTGGGARLGRPQTKEGKKNYITEGQRKDLEALINKGKLNVLNLELEKLPDFQFAHGDWYLNPWVSSDVLVSLNLKLSPKQRGLKNMNEKGLALWYFPNSYAKSLEAALIEYRKTLPH